MEKKKNPFQVSVRDIALIGMMTAVIEVSKLALAAVPNVELVTFWIIMFSLFFGPKVIYSILVFILIEVSIYGVNVWVIMYLYIWPTLALLVLLFKRRTPCWCLPFCPDFTVFCLGHIVPCPIL